jgi:RNA polymerase sigma-70 factor (ECF subfamily)
VEVPDFEQLVHRYHEPLYRFALSLTRREDQAGDLTQETFFLWASKGHQLRDKSKAKSWLFTTLYREYLGSRRRESRFTITDLESAGPDIPVVQPAMFRQIDGATVMNSLGEVDELYRTPLTLFYLDEMSYAEIAQALDIPIGTVMSRLSRGKELLRRMLHDQMSEESKRKIIPLDRAAEGARQVNE